MTIWMSLAGLAGLAVLLTACGGAPSTDVARSTPNTSRLGLLPSGQTAFTYLSPLPATKKAANERLGKAFGDPARYPIQLNTEVFYALAVGDTFVIAVPTVGEVSVKVLSRVVHLGQAVSLVGEVVGEVVGQPAGRVHLSGSGTALSGAIVLDAQTWHVRSTAQGATLQNEAAAGIEELPPHTPEGYRAAQERQLREEQRPPPAITPPALTLPDFSSPTAPKTGTPTPSSTPSSVTPKSAAANGVATIDLLFISDTSYQQRMGSQNAELADLANIVTVGNDAYAQSNALVQLRMAGYQRLSVDWTNVTLQDLLSDLKLMGGSFATTWAQTVLSGADVPVAVSAFTAAKGSFCGMGTVGTFNSAGVLNTGLEIGRAHV